VVAQGNEGVAPDITNKIMKRIEIAYLGIVGSANLTSGHSISDY